MSLPNLSDLLITSLPRNRLQQTKEPQRHESGLYCLDRAATAGGAVVADGNRVNWAVIAAKCGNGMLGIIVTVVRTAVSTMMQMLVGVKEGGAAASDGASTREKAKKRD